MDKIVRWCGRLFVRAACMAVTGAMLLMAGIVVYAAVSVWQAVIF